MTAPTHTRSRMVAAVVATAALVLLAGACSSGSDDKAQTTSETRSDSATDSPTTTDDDGSPTTTAPAGKVIGSSTGQHRASPNDSTSVPLRLDVRAVERLSGDTVEVRFSITNTSDVDTFKPYSELGDPSMNSSSWDVGGVALLDRPNDRKYLTLFDTNDECLCTSGLGDLAIAPGATATMYADVTAPPESVKTVDLSVPGFDPIPGLAIR